jgi:hypothetical protein
LSHFAANKKDSSLPNNNIADALYTLTDIKVKVEDIPEQERKDIIVKLLVGSTRNVVYPTKHGASYHSVGTDKRVRIA